MKVNLLGLSVCVCSRSRASRNQCSANTAAVMTQIAASGIESLFPSFIRALSFFGINSMWFASWLRSIHLLQHASTRSVSSFSFRIRCWAFLSLSRLCRAAAVDSFCIFSLSLASRGFTFLSSHFPPPRWLSLFFTSRESLGLVFNDKQTSTLRAFNIYEISELPEKKNIVLSAQERKVFVGNFQVLWAGIDEETKSRNRIKMEKWLCQ